MSSAPVPRLELLIPWELPIEQPLSAADQSRIERALHSLLQALQEPDAVALTLINQALEQLSSIDSTPSQLSSTKTALQQPEIEDFDHYFEAVHVQTTDPVGCLVRGLLLTYQRALQLWLSGDFDPQQIAYQKQGFVSYGYLILRVFQLPDPVTEISSKSISENNAGDRPNDST